MQKAAGTPRGYHGAHLSTLTCPCARRIAPVASTSVAPATLSAKQHAMGEAAPRVWRRNKRARHDLELDPPNHTPHALTHGRQSRPRTSTGVEGGTGSIGALSNSVKTSGEHFLQIPPPSPPLAKAISFTQTTTEKKRQRRQGPCVRQRALSAHFQRSEGNSAFCRNCRCTNCATRFRCPPPHPPQPEHPLPLQVAAG